MRLIALLCLLVGAVALPAQTQARVKTLDEVKALKEDTTNIYMSETTSEMLAELPRLTKLDALTISPVIMATVEDGLAHIGKLKSLTKLSILGCSGFADAEFEHLTKLTELKSLELMAGKFSDEAVTKLCQLSKLTKLDLSHNSEITGTCFSELPETSLLLDLSLMNCAKVATPGYKAIATLPKLQRVNLSGTVVTPENVSALAASKTLIELTMNGTTFDDSVCESVVTITNLEILRLNRAGITDAGGVHFAKLLNLTKLDLSKVAVGDKTFAAFKAHPKLKILRADRSAVTVKGLAHLKTIPELIELSLDDVNVGEAGAKEIAQCTKLYRLLLDGSSINDAAIDHIATMTSLTSLDLTDNAISAKAALKLKALTKLVYLVLRKNKSITKEVADELQASFEACRIAYDKPRK